MKHFVFSIVFVLISVLSLAQSTFEDQVVLLKVKEDYRNYCNEDGIQEPGLISFLNGKTTSISKKFKGMKPPVARSSSVFKPADLSRIYRIEFSSEYNVVKLLENLRSIPSVEYAELNYYSEINAAPNDPLYQTQFHHANVNSEAAWALQSGKKEVRIAILDTGSDLDHPDLVGNHYINVNDPLNGVDDDNNGFVDDTYGWDFVDNDGYPQATINDHGIHVGGLATAEVNNSIGVAGTGNKCTHVPVRVGEDRSITSGYEGVVYAADQGFDIINCSWGSFNYSQFAQDVVQYASVNKGALVVAAAGNNGRDQAYYPAAYNFVLSVAATRQDNQKTGWSNYGHWVDVMAPGESILSTIDDGDYGNNSGTSMASPIVAGIAGLVKSQYPSLTGLQIAERLRGTTSDISQAGNNNDFTDKLGTGLVDAQSALNGLITDPGIVYEHIAITDNQDQSFAIGDTIRIGGIFTNYLGASGNLVATLSSTSNAISLIDSSYDVGVLSAMSTTLNYDEPFEFIIEPNAEINEEIALKLSITDGAYSIQQFIQIVINVDYLNITVNNVELSVSGNSSLGYLDRQGSAGLGFRLTGEESQLYEGNFMLGFQKDDTIYVLDNARDGQASNQDFATSRALIEREAQDTAFASSCVFADTGSMGVQVEFNAFAFDDEGHEDYVIVEYEIVNGSQEPMDSAFAGLFLDWDVIPITRNRAVYDVTKRLAYTFANSGTAGYFGMLDLNEQEPNIYCLDNVQGGSGGEDIFNSFSTDSKYTTLKGGRYNAGGTMGNDVIQVMSYGPFDLLPMDTQKVAFALIGAKLEEDLINASQAATLRYTGTTSIGFEHKNNGVDITLYPNPSYEVLNIQSTEPILSIQIYNMNGALVYSGKENKPLNIGHLDSGIYFVSAETSAGRHFKRLIKQ